MIPKRPFFIFLVILSALLTGCRKEIAEVKTEKVEKIKESILSRVYPLSDSPYYPAPVFASPKLILNGTTSEKKIAPAHTMWKSSSGYDILDIGRNKDRIDMEKFVRREHSYLYDNLEDHNYFYPSPSSIAIKVDTSSIFTFETNRRDTLTQGYPVYIINLVLRNIAISSGFSLPIILEALDSNHKWSPIEEYYGVVCGAGTQVTLMHPGEIVATVVPVHRGAFKTKLRLRFKTIPYDILSDEFKGTIEFTQFYNAF